ncbi:MAG TPA: DegT/DnrJ/EryC1/StrS family aminotransferase, partial [Bacteroidales bacterium]|nr:DegT/DnrJ/EryC1/StrS family aminotransferase [Bacteroidales bacterium]
IEDTAQALGADYTFSSGEVMKAGTIGHSGCTSFFPSKNLGAFGDAGAVFTNDDDLAASLQSVVNHGMTVRYYHDRLGVNSRLDSIQAAILRIKLRHLDEYNQARKEAAAFYYKAFSNEPLLTTPYCSKESSHIYHQYTLLLDKKINRDKLRNYLSENKIPSMIYYPVPLHLQKAYASLGYRKGDFPVTEDLCNRVLSLPMHSEMDKLQLEYITDHILQYLKR